jgi:hypothetical protein
MKSPKIQKRTQTPAKLSFICVLVVGVGVGAGDNALNLLYECCRLDCIECEEV